MIREDYIGFDVKIQLLDRTHKPINDYNYLVEITNNGRTTHLSKSFSTIEDANSYYDQQVTILSK